MSKDKKNIKELLNAYVDGQLSERRMTEVKRLMDHDPKVAAYVDQIEKCRQIISEIPVTPAPEGIEAAVMERLERKFILDEMGASEKEIQGQKQLYVRRLCAVAAMIVLFGVLGTLVYQVVAPSSTGSRDYAKTEASFDEAEEIKTASEIKPVNYKLVLNTADIKRSTRTVSEFLYADMLAGNTVTNKTDNLHEYKITCSTRQAENLMVELQSVIDGFIDAQFILNPDSIQSYQIAFDKTNYANAISLINTENEDLRLERAAKYASVDSDQTMLAKSSEIDADSLEPVKPRLTSSKSESKPVDRKVILTIQIQQK